MNVVLFTPSDRQRMQYAVALRFEVFVDEQHVPKDEELDEWDAESADSVHALAFTTDGDIVATGRYYRNAQGEAHIGRMAVARPFRGQGTGGAILNALIDHARNRGLRTAVLNAQTHAVPFYERHGFAVAGDTYVECGIPHVKMLRTKL